ncbi:hypothetical protein V8B97DRAFT_2102911 [Scleroderma yunnanense]
MYDYILTFQEEVDRFWTKPCLSWAFVFFITNRYIMLLGRIPAFLDNFIRTKDGPCSTLFWTDELLMAIVQITGAVVMSIRIYAIYGRNRRVLYFFVLVLVIITAIALYSLLVKFPASPQNALIPPQGCLHSISQQQALRFAAAWGGQLVFDAMTFGFTVWKLFGMESFGSRSLADILLRDGTMYFAIMTIMNIANITILLVANPNLKYLFSVPTNVICSTLISRLMINIRDPSNESLYTRNMDSSALSIRVVGRTRINELLMFLRPFEGRT